MIYAIPLLIFISYASLLFFEAPMKHGLIIGIVLFLVGILALVYAQYMKERMNSAILKKIIALSIVIQIILAFITFGHNDIFRYLWDGKVILAGFNPYAFSPYTLAQTHAITLPWYWEHLFFKWSGSVYPPVLQIIFALSNLIYQDSLITLKIIFVGFNIGTLSLLYKLTPNNNRHYLAFVALSPLFIYETIGAGHTEAVFMFLLVLSLYLYKSQKSIALGASLAALVLTKFIPLLILPFFIKKKNWLTVSLVGALTTVVLITPFIWGVPIKQLTSPLLLYSQEWTMSPGLFTLVNSTINDVSTSKYLLLAITLLLLFKLWSNKKLSIETKSAGIFLWFLVSSATVFSWYWLWILPLLPLVTTKLRNIALAGIIMFPLQSVIMYFDVADNTIKYTDNGLIWWHQLLLWLPLAMVALYYSYQHLVNRNIKIS